MKLLLTLVLAFAGTNIDDLFIDTFFFAQAETKKQIQAIVLGKYLGIGALVLFSVLGAYMLQEIPEGYIRFLGLVPMALGIREWMENRNEKEINEDAEGAGTEVADINDANTENADSKNIDIKDVNYGLKHDAKGFFGFIIKIALVTISNGADNLGVYMPLFASFQMTEMLMVLIVFAVMVAIWCILSKKLADLPGLRGFLLKHKETLVPIIYVALGVYIMMG